MGETALEELDIKKCKISVVIPTYNEEMNIGGVLTKLKEVISSISNNYEILVINDGSKDDTKSAVEKVGVKVISHPYNIGNGAAVKTGLRKATGDIIVLMDGDGQHNPEDLPRLLEHIKDYDMVVGARDTSSKVKLHRRFANMIYNAFATYITSFKIEDLTSGFRVIRAKMAKKYIHLLPNTFSYPSTITLATIMTGHSVKYVKIRTFYRAGKSKIKLIKDGLRFFLIITKIATLFSPMRIFMPISLICFILGTLNYLYTYLGYSTFTNMSAFLYSTCVIVFMMGLVAEQVAHLRLERTEK